MIIKLDPNKTSNDPKALIHHLLHKPEDNEEITLVQGSESAIKKAWKDARFEKVRDAVIHIKLNPAEDEWMNDESWERGLELLAQEIGFNPLSATVVQHTKKGRTHRHIIVPMIDMATGKTLNLWRYKMKCMKIAKKLELEFHHRPTPARDHTKRYLLKQENMPSDWAEHVQSLPDARESYSNRDMQKTKRYGYELPELRDLFTSLIEQSDSVKAFKAALRENGFELIEKGKRNRIYFRAIDKPDLELNATKLLGLRTKQLNCYLETGNKNDLFNSNKRKHLSNTINYRNNHPSGVLDSQANKEETEPAITQTIPDATEKTAEPPVSIIQPEPSYQSDEGNAGKRKPFVRTAEYDHGNTGNRHQGPASDSRTNGRDDTKRGWGRGQPNSHHSGQFDNPDRDLPNASYGTERTETDDRRRPTGTGRTGQNATVDGACVDPAITEQQRDLNKRLSGLLKRVSGMSALEDHHRTFYGLNFGWNGWVSIPYENILTCRNYELTEDAMREMVDHWKKRAAYHRSPVSSASPEMDRNGSARMKITMNSGDVFYDDGQQLTSTGPICQQTAREIVMAAKAKGWSFVEITGSKQYRDEIAIQCKLQGISCNHPLSQAAEIKYSRIERKIFDNNLKRLTDTVQLQT